MITCAPNELFMLAQITQINAAQTAVGSGLIAPERGDREVAGCEAASKE